MALVLRMDRSSKERNQVHAPVSCTYTDFANPMTGDRYLQLDTFGTRDRDFPGKTSQSIQLNRDSALQLKRIIEQLFGD